MSVSDDVAERAQARVGETLRSKWRLERLLGIGGMAAVYGAVHRNQNRVAIKMLHPEHSVDQNVKSRFLREGYVANTVEHHGAVRIYDDDVTEDGAAFLVMELLEGETLIDRADRKGGYLETGEALVLVDQLLDVLCAAHDKGILHRDIKPDNLFLTTQGELKVLDFGIARVRELSGQRDGGTGVGTFMGTPSFMAPEQARARWEDVDVRSDVWAVGATLFTLLSGRNVHEADTITEQLVLAVTQPAPSLAVYRPDLPAPVIDVVDKALAYRREDRWQTAKEMQVALRELLTSVVTAPTLKPPRTSLVSINAHADSGDTLAAPLEILSQLAGNRRSGTLASAVTNAGTDRPTRSRRNAVLFALAAGGVLAAALVGMLVTERPSSAPPEASAALRTLPPPPKPAAAPAVRPFAPPPVVIPSPTDHEDAGGAVTTPSAHPPAARPASRPAARPASRPPAPAGRPKPATSAAASSTPSPNQAPNPFDKRY
jgi:serine/threonine-protein kinase